MGTVGATRVTPIGTAGPVGVARAWSHDAVWAAVAAVAEANVKRNRSVTPSPAVSPATVTAVTNTPPSTHTSSTPPAAFVRVSVAVVYWRPRTRAANTAGDSAPSGAVASRVSNADSIAPAPGLRRVSSAVLVNSKWKSASGSVTVPVAPASWSVVPLGATGSGASVTPAGSAGPAVLAEGRSHDSVRVRVASVSAENRSRSTSPASPSPRATRCSVTSTAPSTHTATLLPAASYCVSVAVA